MTLDNSQKDDIKSRLDLAEVISGYIELRKAGVNYKARCPFHNEKTPSFVVSPEKQIWHCFGCGEGGDVFTFVMKIEGMDFPETLRKLAKQAGVELREVVPTLQTSAKSKLFEMHRHAVAFYQKILTETREGREATQYLINRKISEASISQFALGFSPPGWDGLLRELRARGYQDADAVRAGLAVKNDQGRIYDRFRGRIMFPIFSPSGDPVGFGAREFLESGTGSKYINTPTTEIYNKSQQLYGLNLARASIRKTGFAIIVEGYTDVIMSHQAGIANTIAASGTALTDGQLNILKRYSTNVVLAFDMDLAGDLATRRGIELALRQGLNVKIVRVKDQGKDPADIIAQSREGWLEVLKHKQPVGEYVLDYLLARVPAGDIMAQKKAIREYLTFLVVLSDELERRHYLKTLAERAQIEEAIIFSEYEKIENRSAGKRPESATEMKTKTAKEDGSREVMLANHLLSLLLYYPKLFIQLDEETRLMLSRNVKGDLYREVESFYNTHAQGDWQSFRAALEKISPDLVRAADLLVLKVEAEQVSLEEAALEMVRVIKALRMFTVRREISQKTRELRSAEAAKDDLLGRRLMAEVSALAAKLQSLE